MFRRAKTAILILSAEYRSGKQPFQILTQPLWVPNEYVRELHAKVIDVDVTVDNQDQHMAAPLKKAEPKESLYDGPHVQHMYASIQCTTCTNARKKFVRRSSDEGRTTIEGQATVS